MEKLKILRKERGMSQAQMAQQLNLSFRGYQNIEYGVNETNFETLIKIADFFGCSVDYLLGHETKGIIHLDSYTPLQQKLIEMLRQLNDDQTLQLFGYCSGMLGIPFDNARPPRPW